MDSIESLSVYFSDSGDWSANALRDGVSFSMPELNEVGRRLTDCNFLTYSYLSGFRNGVAAIMIALLPLSEESGVRLLRNIFRRNRLPVGGFVVVHVVGRSESRSAALRTRIVFDADHGYWMNGLALSTVARTVSAGKGVQTGVQHSLRLGGGCKHRLHADHQSVARYLPKVTFESAPNFR